MTKTDDPCDLGALLAPVVEAHCANTGQSVADVARAAGLAPQALYRALRLPDVRPPTVRKVLRVLGLRLVVVPR